MLQKIFIALLLCLSFACKPAAESSESDKKNDVVAEKTFKLELKWKSDSIFKIPESVMYDAEKDILYVSNVNGSPFEKDGNGFISKLGLDGQIIDLEWAKGLNAPKGMCIDKGFLYVSDIDRLVKIDLESGEIADTYETEGAVSLNDLALDVNGNIIVSDSRRDYLYKYDGETLEPWLDMTAYKGPNGLLAAKGKLMLGVADMILSVSPEGEIDTLMLPGKGGIDGLKMLSNGNFITSDWAGSMYLVEPEKQTLVLSKPGDRESTADIELIEGEESLVFVPAFYANTVEAYIIR